MALRKVTNNTIESNTIIGTNIQIEQIEDYHLVPALRANIQAGNNNVWVNSNDFSTYSTLKGMIDSVQENVASLPLNEGNYLWTNTNTSVGTSNVYFIGKSVDNIEQLNIYMNGLLQSKDNYILNSSNDTIQFKETIIPTGTKIDIDGFYFSGTSFIYEQDSLQSLSKIRFMDKYPTIQNPTSSINFSDIDKTEGMISVVQPNHTYTINAKRQLERIAPNTPRVYHDPNTGERLGILKEAERFNFLTNSQNPASNASVYRTAGTGSITANAAQAPDLSNSAIAWVPDTDSTNHGLDISANHLPDDGEEEWSFDVFCKSNGYPNVGVRIWTGSEYFLRCTANLANGVVYEQGGGTWKLDKLSNNWFWLQGTNVFSSSSAGLAILNIESLPADTLVQSVFPGDGVSGIYFWRPKLTIGNVACLPIEYVNPTDNSTVQADEVSTTIPFDNYENYENTIHLSVIPRSNSFGFKNEMILASFANARNNVLYEVNAEYQSNLDTVVNSSISLSNLSSFVNTSSEIIESNALITISNTFNTGIGNAFGVEFDNSGDNMFVLYGGGVYTYELSDKHNISSGSVSNIYVLPGFIPTARAFEFSKNGDYLYVADAVLDVIAQFDLSTSWQPNTATFMHNLDIATNTGQSRGFHFSNDGTKLLLGGIDNDRIAQYNLSTSWNVATATYYDRSMPLNLTSTNPCDTFTMSEDGTKCFTLGADANLTEYTLSEAYDITTMQYHPTLSIADTIGAISVIYDLDLAHDGSKVFSMGGTNVLITYDLATSFDLSTASYTREFSDNVSSATLGTSFNSDGTKLYTAETSGTDRIKQFNLTEAYNTATATYNTEFYVSGYSNFQSIALSNNDANVYVLETSNITQYTMSTPGDLNSASLTASQRIEDVISINDSANFRGIDFSDNGHQIYLADQSDLIYEVSLTTNYDITTMKVNTRVTFPTADDFYSFAISDDGTNLYTVPGSANTIVQQYSLSTPWDINTASYTNSLDLTPTGETFPVGVGFSNDGQCLYVSGLTNDNVTQYNLSTAWNVATSTLVGNSVSFAAQEGSSRGMEITSNGKLLFITGTGSGAIHKYELSTAHDISTMALSQSSRSFSNLDLNICDISFNDYGTRGLLTNFGRDTIDELELEVPWDLDTIEVVDTATFLEMSNPLCTKLKNSNVYVSDLANRFYQVPWGRFTTDNASRILSNLYGPRINYVLMEGQVPTGIKIDSSGTNVYVISDTFDNIIQISMTEPFNINSRDYSPFKLYKSNLVASHEGITMKRDNKKMYTVNSTGSVITELELPINNTIEQPINYEFTKVYFGQSGTKHDSLIIKEINTFNNNLSNTDLNTLTE